MVERKGERVRARRRVHRRKAEQRGLDGERVGVAHVGVRGERHRRIEIGAVAADAAMHGAQEIRIAVVADAGFPVGRDVGRVDGAEGQGEGKAAGKFLSVFRGVADHAIGGVGEIFAAFYETCLRQRGGGCPPAVRT